jgi:hypothetical protein
MITEVLMILDDLCGNHQSSQSPPSDDHPSSSSPTAHPVPQSTTERRDALCRFFEDDNHMALEQAVRCWQLEDQGQRRRALESLKSFSSLKHPEAKYNLALSLFKMCSESPFAQDVDPTTAGFEYELATLDLHILTETQRTGIACQLLKDAADAGLAVAQCRYGMMLMGGEKSVTNLERAKYYLGSSAVKDNADAQYYLARLYDEVNRQLANDWYRTAAQNGNEKVSRRDFTICLNNEVRD